MTKTNKKIYLLIIISLFFVFFGLTKITQAQTPPASCYSGSWVQPTCNPVTSDPGSCGILPPLFSGANCGQHTGYLRIQNESDANNQRYWVVLRGTDSKGSAGQILVGDTLGSWVYNTVTDPGVFAKGPITSGQFDSWPAVGPGGIVAQNSLRSQGTLYVGTNTFTTGYISASGALKVNATPVSVGGSPAATVYIENPSATLNPILYIKQNSFAGGKMIDMYSSDSNNVYFDTLGYLNATKDFQIRVDSDNNFNQNYFRIVNGSNATVFSVNEDGSAAITNDATIQRNLYAGAIVANSGGAGNGTIRGNFVESATGNICNADDILVYRGAPLTPGWYCADAGGSGIGGQNLLEVLQEGADASSFDSAVSIGTDFNGLTVVAPEGVSGPALINIKNKQTVSLANQLIGALNFGDGYNTLNQAKIEVARGANNGGGNYPTNMSFWTTSVGTSLPQERMTILHNGNVGIATNAPNEKFEVYDNTAGAARIRITDLTQNPELQLQYNTGVNDHWGIYNSQADDSLRVWGGGSDRLFITQGGLVGVGNNTPSSMFHIHGSASGWSSGFQLTRAGYTGDFRINVISTDTYFRNMTAGQNFEFRNSADTNIFKIYAGSPYSITGNFAAYNGTSCTDGQVLIKDSSNRWVCSSGGGLSTPGGSDTQVQYNNGGAFGGASALVYDNLNSRVGVGQTIPVAKLDVAQNAMSGDIVRITNTGGGGSNQTNLNLQQSGGNIGRMINMDVWTADQDTYFDYLGYLNSDGNFQIRIDANNNSASAFRINNGGNQTIFSLEENGTITGNTLSLKSTGFINFMTDNESIVKASISTVNGDSIFSSSRIETTSINHKETILQASYVTIYFKPNCNGCSGSGGGGGARNIDAGLLERLAKYANYIFAIPSANALPICYYNCNPTSAADCSSLGAGWYEVSQVYPYTFTENALGCSSAPPDYCLNNTQSWPNLVYSRTCKKDSGGEGLYTKIEFAGSPTGGFPGVTKVKDNLVVEQNLYGDGVTTGCEWKDGGTNPKMCDPGKFVGGVNFSNQQIYCCDL